MNIQILPNWCKKVGVLVFLIFAIPSAVEGFIDGLNDSINCRIEATKTYQDIQPGMTKPEIITNYFEQNTLHLFNVLNIIGLLIYMLSKEKIEDDYISMLRLESYQLTIVIFLVFSIMIYAFFKDLKLSIDYFISGFMMLFLIIFFIKKRIY
ncbi:hypothetical protein [Pseudotamlana agarivorans]|uniref:hypothetical protein n=1 Tax=Pseudotamlana agarivorans TaxID=481183 RepID=UPI000830C3E8|nr:hypothetical protein [Tamlana agarivorans]